MGQAGGLGFVPGFWGLCEVWEQERIGGGGKKMPLGRAERDLELRPRAEEAAFGWRAQTRSLAKS